MQITTIMRVLGILLIVFSVSMLPPIAIGMLYHDGATTPFFMAYFVTVSAGAILWIPTRTNYTELKTRDGFLIVVLFWVVLSMFASLPLMLIPHLHETFTDAVFEATSGLTTTGASVLTNLDNLPHSVRFYRQELQFLGGMGIIVLAVAILPMLGVGGMQLYRAEMPGPIKDTKLTPRITETAKALWYIYVGLTISCALCYRAAGMELFDAIGESFSTVATGGFSMHDNSFSYYHNTAIELIATAFMILGGTNFSLHFVTLRRTSFAHYWSDQEFRAYISILLGTTLVTFFVLFVHQTFANTQTTMVKSLFNVVSLATTTGFESARFETWPSFVPILIMFVATIGGCASSTCGGMKVLRILLLQKQALREVMRLIHPNAIIQIKFGKQILPDSVVQAMWAFIATFALLFIVLMLLLMADGNDFTTTFGALVASLANAGNAIGGVADNFAHLTTTTKWILIFAMFAGRLEIFTLLVLFTPAFWRR